MNRGSFVAGLLLIIAGSLVVAQVTVGQALQRLGVIS